MARAVLCFARDADQAEQVVAELRNAGFSNNDISVLLPDPRSSATVDLEKHSKAPEGATAGAGTGGLLGGALGWLVGIGSLAIPGLGPFIAAGPILAALSGAAVGAAVGGLAGAMVGMGIPELEAKRYEGKLQDGNVLISVHTTDMDERTVARRIFERAGGEDISYTTEASL
jgi:outer membrane lipoprotein SlyB